jgi:hypothetical protein
VQQLLQQYRGAIAPLLIRQQKTSSGAKPTRAAADAADAARPRVAALIEKIKETEILGSVDVPLLHG